MFGAIVIIKYHGFIFAKSGAVVVFSINHFNDMKLVPVLKYYRCNARDAKHANNRFYMLLNISCAFIIGWPFEVTWMLCVQLYMCSLIWYFPKLNACSFECLVAWCNSDHQVSIHAHCFPCLHLFPSSAVQSIIVVCALHSQWSHLIQVKKMDAYNTVFLIDTCTALLWFCKHNAAAF